MFYCFERYIGLVHHQKVTALRTRLYAFRATKRRYSALHGMACRVVASSSLAWKVHTRMRSTEQSRLNCSDTYYNHFPSKPSQFDV